VEEGASALCDGREMEGEGGRERKNVSAVIVRGKRGAEGDMEDEERTGLCPLLLQTQKRVMPACRCCDKNNAARTYLMRGAHGRTIHPVGLRSCCCCCSLMLYRCALKCCVWCCSVNVCCLTLCSLLARGVLTGSSGTRVLL